MELFTYLFIVVTLVDMMTHHIQVSFGYLSSFVVSYKSADFSFHFLKKRHRDIDVNSIKYIYGHFNYVDSSNP